MDTQTLRQRPQDQTTNTAPWPTPSYDDVDKTKRDKKLAMARRGLRSLVAAVVLPLLLSTASSVLWSSKPDPSRSWSPPIWVMHAAAAASSSLMGLAAWLVWAEGGMRSPVRLSLYSSQLVLGLAWPPAMKFAESGLVGIGLSLALLAALGGCAKSFRPVNPIAGDLAKLCLAWASLLAVASYKMM